MYPQVISKQWLNKKNEGAAVTLSTISYEIDNETRARWAERDEAEARRRKLQAVAYLEAAAKASNPAKTLTSQWKVLPEDREMIAKDILSRVDREIYGRVEPGQKFPSDKAGDSFWTRTFYRYLDTIEPTEIGAAIVEAEHRTFMKVRTSGREGNRYVYTLYVQGVKPRLVEEGTWKDEGEVSAEVQRIADKEIAGRLRVSFLHQVKIAGSKGEVTKGTFCKFKR